MAGFGEKLKGIRESRGVTIETISRATMIHPSYLEAVERDDVEVLPGPAYVKFYIRAYADVIGFDPASLIKEYDLELAASEPAEVADAPPPDHEWKQALRKSREEASARRMESLDREELEREREEAWAEEEPVLMLPEEPERERPEYPGRPWRLLAAAAVVSVVVSVLVWAYMACFGAAEIQVDERAESSAEKVTPLQQPREQPVDPRPEVVEREPRLPPGPLSVTEHGVGRRLVGRRLEGRDDSFTEGEVVWFSTRVLGGRPGDIIRHYWFREGGRVQIVDLELGSSHWRTRSKKTLWGVGDWAVEARDPEGRVLARDEFTCVAR